MNLHVPYPSCLKIENELFYLLEVAAWRELLPPCSTRGSDGTPAPSHPALQLCADQIDIDNVALPKIFQCFLLDIADRESDGPGCSEVLAVIAVNVFDFVFVLTLLQ